MLVFHGVFAGPASKPDVSIVGRLGTRHPGSCSFYSFLRPAADSEKEKKIVIKIGKWHENSLSLKLVV